MKAYSVDLRTKIVAAHCVDKRSIRQVAQQFDVSPSYVQKLVKQYQTEGNLQPKKRGKPRFSYLTNAEPELKKLVTKYPDATLNELCELFAVKTGHSVSRSALCRALQKAGLRRKKNLLQSKSRYRKSAKTAIRITKKS